MPDKNDFVKAGRWIFAVSVFALGGCETAHKVAVSSFNVIDAPARYVRRHLDEPQQTTTTTTTVESDAVTPGRPVNVAPVREETQRRKAAADNQPKPSATPRVSASASAQKSKTSSPAPQRNGSAPAAAFPTAKVVPGKPGYVFSPFDPNGGYVDVNGYPPGSKVKDPYSGKVFLVP